jgi:hypothetical protein
MASEMLEQLDLSQSAFCEDLLAEDIGNLFNCYSIPSLAIGGCAAHLSGLAQ